MLAPGAAYGRLVGQRLNIVSFAFCLSPVKVFSPEGLSTVGKQSLLDCHKCRNLLYLPVPLPASSGSPGSGVFGVSRLLFILTAVTSAKPAGRRNKCCCDSLGGDLISPSAFWPQ